MTTHSAHNDLFFGRKGKAARTGIRRGPTSDSPTQGAGASGNAEIDREMRANIIRTVLGANRISTVFQPIVDLQTGMTVGAEALSRFASPVLRTPEVWFAEAASVGLGVELELAAIAIALAQFHRFPPDLYMALNVSAPTVVSSGLRAALADAPPDRLVLELTAPVAGEEARNVVRAVHKLRAHGLRLAVDHADGGRLSNSAELEPDIFKLDIRASVGINGDNARQALGSALMRLGMNSSKSILVAEGIETKDEFDMLRSLGCRYGQGYYLGRPGRLREKAPRHGALGHLWVDEEEPAPSSADAEETTESSVSADAGH